MNFIINVKNCDKKLIINRLINITIMKISNDKNKMIIKVLSNNLLTKLLF